jgi:glucokinase
VRRMGEAVRAAVAQAGIDAAAVARVGLGTPGLIDLLAGQLIISPNLRGWENFPIRDRVAAHCQRPVTLANDANAATYGEFWVGSGRDFKSMALLTLGTGIGSGIVVRGRMVEGEHNSGGECGHAVIDSSPDARVCSCGRRGHLEAYASATAVVKRAQESLDAGRASSLRDLVAQGTRLTAKRIAEAASAGDELALEIVRDTARYLAVGIVNIMQTIDPSGILLGGAMTFGGNESSLGRKFLGTIRAEVARYALPTLAEQTTIDFATLGGDAGFIGAAGLARLENGS